VALTVSAATSRSGRGAQLRQAQAAVDPAQLLAGLDHPAGHQRNAMVPFCQFLTLRGIRVG
jgi:hypothetical protein